MPEFTATQLRIQIEKLECHEHQLQQQRSTAIRLGQLGTWDRLYQEVVKTSIDRDAAQQRLHAIEMDRNKKKWWVQHPSREACSLSGPMTWYEAQKLLDEQLRIWPNDDAWIEPPNRPKRSERLEK